MKCDKIPYTLEQAKKVLKKAKDKRRETSGKHKHKVRKSYLCENCGMHHLTSTRLTKEQIDKNYKKYKFENMVEQICKRNKWEC